MDSPSERRSLPFFTSRRSGFVSDLRELKEYRDLLSYLIWRDIAVRYRQAVLGILWVLVQPLFTMLLFTLVFGEFAKVPTHGTPYALFVLSALIPWLYFSNALQRCSNSLVENSHLLTKVYFPRLLLPLSGALGALVDFTIAFVLLCAFALWHGSIPRWEWLLLPVFTLYILTASLALGFWLAALNVKYRDVRHAVPFVLQLLMFATPIVYPLEIIPEGAYRIAFGSNPVAVCVQGFRWIFANSFPPDPTYVLISIGLTVLMFVAGFGYFRATEKRFADVV